MSSVTEARPDAICKGDRALELKEQGVATWQIAVRLGTSSASVSAMLNAARKRRAEKVNA